MTYAVDFVVAHWDEGSLVITGWGLLLALIVAGRVVR